MIGNNNGYRIIISSFIICYYSMLHMRVLLEHLCNWKYTCHCWKAGITYARNLRHQEEHVYTDEGVGRLNEVAHPHIWEIYKEREGE